MEETENPNSSSTTAGDIDVHETNEELSEGNCPPPQNPAPPPPPHPQPSPVPKKKRIILRIYGFYVFQVFMMLELQIK